MNSPTSIPQRTNIVSAATHDATSTSIVCHLVKDYSVTWCLFSCDICSVHIIHILGTRKSFLQNSSAEWNALLHAFCLPWKHQYQQTDVLYRDACEPWNQSNLILFVRRDWTRPSASWGWTWDRVSKSWRKRTDTGFCFSPLWHHRPRPIRTLVAGRKLKWSMKWKTYSSVYIIAAFHLGLFRNVSNIFVIMGKEFLVTRRSLDVAHEEIPSKGGAETISALCWLPRPAYLTCFQAFAQMSSSKGMQRLFVYTSSLLYLVSVVDQLNKDVRRWSRSMPLCVLDLPFFPPVWNSCFVDVTFDGYYRIVSFKSMIRYIINVSGAIHLETIIMTLSKIVTLAFLNADINWRKMNSFLFVWSNCAENHGSLIRFMLDNI